MTIDQSKIILNVETVKKAITLLFQQISEMDKAFAAKFGLPVSKFHPKKLERSWVADGG